MVEEGEGNGRSRAIVENSLDVKTSELESEVSAFAVGRTVTFSKTVGECDVYLFAGLSGDLSPSHVNEAYMRSTRYGHRIAHGALVLAFMSTAASKMLEGAGNVAAVSYGYDHVRFVAPVFIGDTIRIMYKVQEWDEKRREFRAEVTASNEAGDVVAVAVHIMRVLPASGS